MSEVFIYIGSGLSILLGLMHLVSTKAALRGATGLSSDDFRMIVMQWVGGIHAAFPGGSAVGAGAIRSVCRNVWDGGRNLRSCIGRSADSDLFCGLLADEEHNRQDRFVCLPDHCRVLRPGNVHLI